MGSISHMAHGLNPAPGMRSDSYTHGVCAISISREKAICVNLSHFMLVLGMKDGGLEV